MIELSVVILIIGILISGIRASNAIIKKFRIQIAQTLTISSPVNGILDSVLWLESSLDKNFKSSESSDNSYTANISSYSASSGKPRVFTFVHDKSVGKKTYINGLLAAISNDTNHLSGMTTLTIGKSYQGQLGEVVIFARDLTDEERQSVEDYLGKKWNGTILRTVGSSSSSGGIGGSCVGGTGNGTTGGSRGNGVTSSSTTYYGGGGAGGHTGGAINGAAGNGGGGAIGTSGTDGLGGGGGGAPYDNSSAGSGGKGVVIVRYPL